MTALRDRSHDTMYRPGKVATLIADLSMPIAMIIVGAGCIVAHFVGA